MARGFPDFYAGIVPSMPVYGEGQINWMVAEDGDIAGDSFADMGEYTVPAGYELHIMASALGSDFPAITRIAFSIMGIPLGLGYFDTVSSLPLHPAAAYIVTAGLTGALRVFNDDADTHHFAVLALGFLIQVAE